MNYKHIAIDYDTYIKLKESAQNNGRTIVGEIRYLIRTNTNAAASYLDSTSISPFEKPKSEKQIRLQQMQNRLECFEEDSPEYQEALAEIEQLMAE